MRGKSWLQEVKIYTDLVEIRERQPQKRTKFPKGKSCFEPSRSVVLSAVGPAKIGRMGRMVSAALSETGPAKEEGRVKAATPFRGYQQSAGRVLAEAPVDCSFVPHADNSIIDSNFCQAPAWKIVNLEC